MREVGAVCFIRINFDTDDEKYWQFHNRLCTVTGHYVDWEGDWNVVEIPGDPEPYVATDWGLIPISGPSILKPVVTREPETLAGR